MGSLYFAYGSNLSASDWRRWCELEGFDPDSITYLRPAKLAGYALEFSVRSHTRGGGVLNLRPRAGATVWGGLYRVNEAGLVALDTKEAVGRVYRRREVMVTCSQDRDYRVMTYEVLPELCRQVVIPANGYVTIVREALADRGIDATAFEAAVLEGLSGRH